MSRARDHRPPHAAPVDRRAPLSLRPVAAPVMAVVLVLVMALAPAAVDAQGGERLTVLEMFGRVTCEVCRDHAAPALDAIAADYTEQGRPVLVVEHDTNNSSSRGMNERRNRWFRLMGVTRAPLPLILLNGGAETAFGEEEDHEATYRAMIERALAVPPSAEVDGSWAQTGALELEATVRVRNTGDAAIDPRSGDGVWVFVVAERRVVHLGRYAAGVAPLRLAAPLNPGETATVSGTVRAQQGTDLRAAAIFAVVERALGDGRFDVVQGARLPLDTSAPTPPPTSTAEPTPTSPPGPTATQGPVSSVIWLPFNRR